MTRGWEPETRDDFYCDEWDCELPAKWKLMLLVGVERRRGSIVYAWLCDRHMDELKEQNLEQEADGGGSSLRK